MGRRFESCRAHHKPRFNSVVPGRAILEFPHPRRVRSLSGISTETPPPGGRGRAFVCLGGAPKKRHVAQQVHDWASILGLSVPSRTNEQGPRFIHPTLRTPRPAPSGVEGWAISTLDSVGNSLRKPEPCTSKRSDYFCINIVLFRCRSPNGDSGHFHCVSVVHDTSYKDSPEPPVDCI